MFGRRLHVVVEDAQRAEAAIGMALGEGGLQTRGCRVERIVPTLEDVFVSLIEARDRAEQPQRQVRK